MAFTVEALNKKYIGEKIYFLTILKVEKINNIWCVWCKCICENKKYVTLNNYLLTTKSCGCIKFKHGEAKKRGYLYRLWLNGKSRCQNKKHRDYPDYGGRGILWKFPIYKEFAKYVRRYHGERPTPKHSLERINNNGHYEIGNLRWATQREQNLNRRIGKNKTSKYPGVFFNKKTKRYIVHIWLKKKNKYLGTFKSEREAFKKYLVAYKRFHRREHPHNYLLGEKIK